MNARGDADSATGVLRESSVDSRDWLVAQDLVLGHLRGESPSCSLTTRQWNCLAEHAARHRIRGIAYRLLEDGPCAAAVPAEVKEQLRRAYLETAVFNAHLFQQTSRITRKLIARGIDVMLLKGMHLARFVYAEPALRSMADVDLMVRRDRLADAERVFVEEGFGPIPRPDIEERCRWSNHLDKLVKEGAPVVEVHWTIERPRGPFPIDIDGLWSRSRPASLEGAPVRLLAPEDLLLHLILHCSYHHRFDRSALKGLVDIHTVVVRNPSSFDWTSLIDRSIEWKASGFGYTTLRLAREILGTPVPPAVFDSLPHASIDETIIEVARSYILAPRLNVSGVYVKLARSTTLRERGRLIWRSVFLPRRDMERMYRLRAGTRLVALYYVGRVMRLVVQRSSLLVRALFRRPGIRPNLDADEDRLRIEGWVKDKPGRPNFAEDPAG